LALQPAFVDVDSVTQDIRRFRCGKPQMDAFLIRYAVKNAELGISKTWVLLDGDKGEKKKFPVAAYYTLAVGTVTRETLPVDHKELPSYPVPVTLLARLAVSENYQNRGVGGKTLVTALRQAVILKDKGLSSIGVVLDVLDQDALNFYNHVGVFHAFTNNPMRLFVPMHVIQQL
jgi:GNAT superfamily N-acetyltransferase